MPKEQVCKYHYKEMREHSISTYNTFVVKPEDCQVCKSYYLLTECETQ